jgi:hypothetical protein
MVWAKKVKVEINRLLLDTDWTNPRVKIFSYLSQGVTAGSLCYRADRDQPCDRTGSGDIMVTPVLTGARFATCALGAVDYFEFFTGALFEGSLSILMMF